MNEKQEKIKQRWLKALRSGKYKQGKERLYTPETASFCCLGVLQHVLKNGKVDTEWEPTFHDDPHAVDKNGLRSACMPSPDFYEKFDLEWVRANEQHLADLNDHQDLDFNQIADEIEATWT